MLLFAFLVALVTFAMGVYALNYRNWTGSSSWRLRLAIPALHMVSACFAVWSVWLLEQTGWAWLPTHMFVFRYVLEACAVFFTIDTVVQCVAWRREVKKWRGNVISLTGH